MALTVCSPPCILDAMDSLWFHHTILFFSSALLPHQSQLSAISSSTSLSLPTDESQLHQQQARIDHDEEESSITSPPSQKDEGEGEEEARNIIRPTIRVSPVTGRSRSYSSSPLTKKRHRRRLGNRATSSSEQKQGSTTMQPFTIFERTSSCRSLIRELEMEEVKGFMDLGFKFKAESLSPRMKTVVPGLQRLSGGGGGIVISNCNDDVITEDDDDDEGVIIRPYLSEAWLIRRANSPPPLLNVRRIHGAAAPDLRRHIKFWARTVATVIQQESY